jgi:hypothetical protein
MYSLGSDVVTSMYTRGKHVFFLNLSIGIPTTKLPTMTVHKAISRQFKLHDRAVLEPSLLRLHVCCGCRWLCAVICGRKGLADRLPNLSLPSSNSAAITFTLTPILQRYTPLFVSCIAFSFKRCRYVMSWNDLRKALMEGSRRRCEFHDKAAAPQNFLLDSQV